MEIDIEMRSDSSNFARIFIPLKEYFSIRTMKTLFGWFRTVAFWEGVSYVLLLINMLVIKNIDPELGASLVFPIGAAHGALFVGYFILALMTKLQYERSWRWLIIAAIISVVPLGTFFMEKKWKAEEEELLRTSPASENPV